MPNKKVFGLTKLIFEYKYGYFDEGMESAILFDKNSEHHLIKTIG